MYLTLTMTTAHRGKMMATTEPRGKLIAVIGDEDTCVGFLLGGIGEVGQEGRCNFFVVHEKTTPVQITRMFKEMVSRENVAILLITQVVANMIRPTVEGFTLAMPAVLEIPSKYAPYDPNKDSVLMRAKAKMSGDDHRT